MTQNEKIQKLKQIMDEGGCDLHLHTTFSDGSDSPQQLIDRVLASGLKAFAVTDHDTMAGLKVCHDYLETIRKQGLSTLPTFIPGVEISAEFNGEIHICAYFPDGEIKGLLPFLARQRASRQDRNTLLIQRLQVLGYAISEKDFIHSGDGTIGRLQAALLLKEKLYVESVQEAFDTILGEGKPAYITRERPSAQEAIAEILNSGGIPVLAHPHLYGWCRGKTLVSRQLIANLSTLKNFGLAGVEAYHGEAPQAKQQEIAAAGTALNLLITAGSDDHGKNKDQACMYTGHSRWDYMHAVVVAAALITQTRSTDNKTLYFLARRAEQGKFKGFWELPGGKIKQNERPDEALRRELAEELATASTTGSLQYVIQYQYPDTRVILLCIEATLDEPIYLNVHDQAGYYTAKEALSLNLLPADIDLFRYLASRKE